VTEENSPADLGGSQDTPETAEGPKVTKGYQANGTPAGDRPSTLDRAERIDSERIPGTGHKKDPKGKVDR
jgi:hypothetical protein